ncbi:hypothetical protein SAMN05444360_104111 [Chryseobacterium carnipullorum]|uniref:Uncharacterized protein n=1 Tax=Chryseobacterium carnipullorum TaxID=1124835 RepID=A0A1M7DAM8_CHRCU|nr:hypothetical protein SAMN05444360_104111 [Chryseobacterium carnipullorum]STC98712.1 Uncharacterised protein [Chryseobacterium carnipullorum]
MITLFLAIKTLSFIEAASLNISFQFLIIFLLLIVPPVCSDNAE